MAWLVHRIGREEGGFAMIVAIVLLFAAAVLTAGLLRQSSHSDVATGRGRSAVQALHVAEAGAQEAIARLQATNGLATLAVEASQVFSGAAEEGPYDVTITKLARNRYRIDSRGRAGTAAALRAARRIQVTLAPPPSFEDALLSVTSVDTKNNDLVNGDLWANQSVTVDANDQVNGSVTAATGWVQLNNGSRVTGDVWSGGYNPADGNRAIHLGNGARVDGGAKASVTNPGGAGPCGGADMSRYEVRLDTSSSVQGDVKTWGVWAGPGTVGGTASVHVCTDAPATKSLPAFTYNSGNYDPSTLHEYGTPAVPSATAIADFQGYLTAHRTAFKGTFTVFQSGSLSQGTRLDLTGMTIDGDTTIVTNAPVFANGVTDTSGGDRIFVLVSTYQPPAGTQCDVNQDGSECSVHIKNNLQPSCNTAVLVYSPNGPVAVKNNQDACGAVYAQNLQIKNNQTLTYDPRVERVVGFGEVTLKIEKWVELASG